MKIIFIILISVFLFSTGFSQQKPAQKNTDENKISYNKNKAANVLDSKISNQMIESKKEESKTKKGFGSANNSGSEIKLEKNNNQNLLSNEELKKKLNNPRKLKKIK